MKSKGFKIDFSIPSYIAYVYLLLSSFNLVAPHPTLIGFFVIFLVLIELFFIITLTIGFFAVFIVRNNMMQKVTKDKTKKNYIRTAFNYGVSFAIIWGLICAPSSHMSLATLVIIRVVIGMSFAFLINRIFAKAVYVKE